MKYPLIEQIGDPDLFIGRSKEFTQFNKWIKNIPKRLSKSRVILARKKSGKSAFVERIFNILWNENGDVIPFHYGFSDKKIWFPDFVKEYYQKFASQYISFLERDEIIAHEPLPLELIKEYGQKNKIDLFVGDIDSLLYNEEKGSFDLMWRTACAAPQRFAAIYGKPVLVILDEFQYSSNTVFYNKSDQVPDDSMPGSYHNLVESKIAPMLVTGSYVSWMVDIMTKHLEAGRLTPYYIEPYLSKEEGLQAVYKYAEVFDENITNKTAEQINELCMSDPFFISRVFKSNCDNKNLAIRQGVIDTVHYEIANKRSMMSKTWKEYIDKTIKKINDANAKNILLLLSKYNDREWTPMQIRDELQLKLSTKEIHRKLEQLVEADLIEEGSTDIRYEGLKDGTLYLVITERFKDEIKTFTPDLLTNFNEKLSNLEKQNKSLKARLNNLVGKFAEYQLATDFRTRKRFSLSIYFEGVKDKTRLNIIDVSMRVKIQRKDGKEMEFDIVATSDCKREVIVEVKKWEKKVGVQVVRDFIDKFDVYSKMFSKKKVLPAFLSVGGFTAPALKLLKSKKIGTATQIEYYDVE